MINQPDEYPDMATYKLREIKPNPFRHIERYPIRRDKVEALIDSFRVTGYWGNIVARPSPDPDGGAEIAYGHHRLAALREYYKDPNQSIALLVRTLPDEQMLQIMARENMEEWGTSAVIEQETVRAVVEAYATGQIELPNPKGTTRPDALRYAPSFQAGESGSARNHSYSIEQITEFLGWNAAKVGNTLRALELVERGILADSDFDGLSTKAAEAVTTEARRAADEQERTARLHQKQADSASDEQSRSHFTQLASDAREKGHKTAAEVGKAISQKLKHGDIGVRQAREEVGKIHPLPPRALSPIEAVAFDLSKAISTFLNPHYDERGEKLEQIINNRGALNQSRRSDLVTDLRKAAHRLNDFAERLDEVDVEALVSMGGRK